MLLLVEDCSVMDVVTCGGCQSAHAAAISRVACYAPVSRAERRLKTRLLLRGEQPEILTGYNLISTMYGSVTYVPSLTTISKTLTFLASVMRLVSSYCLKINLLEKRELSNWLLIPVLGLLLLAWYLESLAWDSDWGRLPWEVTDVVFRQDFDFNLGYCLEDISSGWRGALQESELTQNLKQNRREGY
ncbi:hypothetical protein MLD38_008445 [Melastoma candidum]|uniref:Uncharacterized protein n=1 Tax=Melastoma candidum TaxID=119954 RepID=A0ACB9RYN1_9MYRT|nr:hypothetical protein MLD38_008445 [Melastoma candidum]